MTDQQFVLRPSLCVSVKLSSQRLFLPQLFSHQWFELLLHHLQNAFLYRLIVFHSIPYRSLAQLVSKSNKRKLQATTNKSLRAAMFSNKNDDISHKCLVHTLHGLDEYDRHVGGCPTFIFYRWQRLKRILNSVSFLTLNVSKLLMKCAPKAAFSSHTGLEQSDLAVVSKC